MKKVNTGCSVLNIKTSSTLNPKAALLQASKGQYALEND